MVAPEKLRFDFCHFEEIKKDEVSGIEELMNERIMENVSIITKEMVLDQAIKTGATALFEEKYGKNVRVVNIGDYSHELCAGMYVNNAGEIGFFKIISESSIAAWICMIEAVTRKEAITRTRQKKCCKNYEMFLMFRTIL